MGFFSRRQRSDAFVPGYQTDEAFRGGQGVSEELLEELYLSVSNLTLWLRSNRPQFDATAEVCPNEKVLMTFPVWVLGGYSYPAGGSYSGGSVQVAADQFGRRYLGQWRMERRAFSVRTKSTGWKPTRKERTPEVPTSELYSYSMSVYDYDAQEQAIRELLDSMRSRWEKAKAPI